MKQIQYKIRPLQKSDINECASMAIESFGTNEYPKEQFDTMKEEFKAMFGKQFWGTPNYFVCEHKGKILGMGGYALSWLDWDTFEFFWLSVRKEYYGQGIGEALVKHREKEILKKSAFKTDITIMFSCTNSVIGYHKKHGYNVLLKKAGGKEVIMGKTFLKNEYMKKKKLTAKDIYTPKGKSSNGLTVNKVIKTIKKLRETKKKLNE